MHVCTSCACTVPETGVMNGCVYHVGARHRTQNLYKNSKCPIAYDFFKKKKQSKEEERVYFISKLQSIAKGSQGTLSRNWHRHHGGTLLTGFLSMACWTCFLTQPRTTFPGGGTTHGGGLSSLISIINPEMTHHRISHRQSDRGIFSINVPSSEITLAYVRLEKKKHSTFTRPSSIMFYSNDTEPVVQDTPVTPALGRVGQENCESEVMLGYMVRPGLR